MQNTKRRWPLGVAGFLIAAAMLYFVLFPIQRALGLWGLVITELVIVAIAVGGVAAGRKPWAEAFPIRMPRANQAVGTVIILLAGTAVNIPLTYLIFYFFPEAIQRAMGIANLTAGLPLPIAWFVVALLPAVCEEALFRGFLFHSFREIRSKWLLVVLVGCLFGLFHFDFIRLVPLMFIGTLITYTMAETENLLIPMLYHLLNNSMSVMSGQSGSSSLLSGSDALYEVLFSQLSFLGIYLILGGFGVLALRGGVALLRYGSDPAPADWEEYARRKRRLTHSWLIAGGIALAMMVVGTYLFSSNIEETFGAILSIMDQLGR